MKKILQWLFLIALLTVGVIMPILVVATIQTHPNEMLFLGGFGILALGGYHVWWALWNWREGYRLLDLACDPRFSHWGLVYNEHWKKCWFYAKLSLGAATALLLAGSWMIYTGWPKWL